MQERAEESALAGSKEQPDEELDAEEDSADVVDVHEHGVSDDCLGHGVVGSTLSRHVLRGR